MTTAKSTNAALYINGEAPDMTCEQASLLDRLVKNSPFYKLTSVPVLYFIGRFE
jgi:hypothetical protein